MTMIENTDDDGDNLDYLDDGDDLDDGGDCYQYMGHHQGGSGNALPDQKN